MPSAPELGNICRAAVLHQDPILRSCVCNKFEVVSLRGAASASCSAQNLEPSFNVVVYKEWTQHDYS